MFMTIKHGQILVIIIIMSIYLCFWSSKCGSKLQIYTCECVLIKYVCDDETWSFCHGNCVYDDQTWSNIDQYDKWIDIIVFMLMKHIKYWLWSSFWWYIYVSDHQNVDKSCKFIHVTAFWSNMCMMITHDPILIVMLIWSIQLCLWWSQMVQYSILSSCCRYIYHSHM